MQKAPFSGPFLLLRFSELRGSALNQGVINLQQLAGASSACLEKMTNARILNGQLGCENENKEQDHVVRNMDAVTAFDRMGRAVWLRKMLGRRWI
jgi:hypothetical protein